jgi:ATP/maltotriose-dependent transcriptional regulator MalT/DNA-binding SARP family transcriptional activator
MTRAVASLASTFRHQISPLAFDASKLHRERLVDAIHANLPRKLIVVVAPPGYGKSTLLADFSAHTDMPVCWARLTEADQDVMRLAALLAASLQRRYRRLRDEPDLKALSTAPPEALARAFAETLERRIDEALVIAIDDVHLLNASPPALEFLDALLREQPRHLTLLTAGRELPEVSMARLVADGEMFGIGVHDLALTRGELVGLTSRVPGGTLPAREVDQLLEETQGWISGVLLSANLGRGEMTGVGRPMVYEYLASVAFSRKPEDVCRFMLESAVLPVMTAEACDRVQQRRDSQRYLTRLLREGLFVVSSEQTPRTYEYHPLFRRFLIETLAGKEPAHLRALRERAAAVAAEIGMSEEAVALFLEAGKEKRAAALMERYAPGMFEHGRTQTLEAWAKRLEGGRARIPGVLLYLATAYTDRGDLAAAEDCLARVMDTLGKPSSAAQRLLVARAETVRGLVALQRGDYEAVAGASARAEALLPRRGARVRRATCLRLKARAEFGRGRDLLAAVKLAERAVRLFEGTGDTYSLAQAYLDLSMIRHAQGRDLEAEEAALRAHDAVEQLKAPLPLAISFNNQAVHAHFAGRYEQALELFTQALKHAHQAASLNCEANILFGQADVFNDLGLAFQAGELYAQGLRQAMRLKNTYLLRYGYVQTSVLHRRNGTGKLALEWLDRARGIDAAGERPASIDIQLAALSIPASPRNARRRLADLLRKTDEGLHAGDHALALFFQARAALAEEKHDRAREQMRAALEWAGAHDVLQVLAGELMNDEDMLGFAAHSLAGNSILATLVERIEVMRAVARRYAESPEEEPAPARLGLVALGPSDIFRDGKRVADLEPLPRQLLFYLADRGRAERNELLEAFWRDSPVGRQASSLYTAMHALRRALGRDVVQIEGSVYSLNQECSVRYDVAEFERAASIAERMPLGDPRRLFALTEAVNAYTGPFLPEVSLDWALDRGRELEERFVRLLSAHAGEALARGQAQQALTSFRQALKIDPLRDDLNLRYLELLGQLDRRSEAVGHYQNYVRLLADELGLDPPQSIRDAYARLIG